MIVTLLMTITFIHTLYFHRHLTKVLIDYKDLDKVLIRIGLENDSRNEPSSNEKTHGD